MAPELQKFLDAFAAIGRAEPARLLDVLERLEDGLCTGLVLVFSSQHLALTANSDDDTVSVSMLPAEQTLPGYRRSIDTAWNPLRGKTFGWGWVTVNQQGYCDGVLLSFETLEPCVVINVIGSTLKTQSIATSARPDPLHALMPSAV